MLENQLQTFRVQLTVRAPVVSQTSSGKAYGIDVQPARKEGRVMLPGSLVRGKLRQAWAELRDLAGDAFRADLEAWMGPVTEEEERPRIIETRRGRLRLGDFLATTEEQPTVRHRIQIEDTHGSVVKGALGAMEMPWGVGQPVDFEGQISFVGCGAESQELRDRLEAGLSWIDGFGSGTGLGFGRLLGVVVEPLPPQALQAAPSSFLEGTRFDLCLTPRDPLLVATRSAQGNLFEGGPVIPGASLKGALASTLREALGHAPAGAVDAALGEGSPFAELTRHFAAVRFTHALYAPRQTGRRPLTPPCSLVQVGDELFDVALLDGPHLFAVNVQGEDGTTVEELRAPSFAPDWKGSKAHHDLGWAPVDTEARVRNANDAALRRGAEGSLFVYRSVLPSEDKAYFGHLDLSRVPEEDQDAVAHQLQRLLHGDGSAAGLRNVGRTKARLDVDFQPVGTFPLKKSGRRVASGDPWVVVLQTPALLLDASGLDETKDAAALHAAYQSAWRDLLGDAVLLRLFTKEELVGGRYLWRRFRPGTSYHPDVLAAEGSVFVFDSPPETVRRALEDAAQRGLPLPSWKTQQLEGVPESEYWKHCPFVPENGYGEIVLHPDLPRPPPERVRRVQEVGRG